MKRRLLEGLVVALIFFLGLWGPAAAGGTISDESFVSYGPVAPEQRLPIVLMHYKCNRLDANLLYVVVIEPTVPERPIVIPSEVLKASPAVRTKVFIVANKAGQKGLLFSRILRDHGDCLEG